MRKPGINTRVMLLANIPAMIIALLLTFHSIMTSVSAVDNGLHERGRTIAMQLALASEYGVISGNYQILQSLLQQTMNQVDINAVLV